jgi:UDP-N-acetylglucosamine 2-epimerase
MKRLFVVSDVMVENMRSVDVHNGDILLATDIDSESVMKAAGMDFLTLDYYSREREDYRAEAAMLLREWGKKSLGSERLEEKFNYEGMPFWKIFETDIVAYLVENTNALRVLSAIRKAIITEKPDIVVCENVSFSGNIGLAAAEFFGIEHEKIRTGIGARFNLHKKGALNHLHKHMFRISEFKRRHINRKARVSGGNKNKILVVTSIQTSLPIIYPVIVELKKNPDNDVVVLRYDVLRSRMKKHMNKMGIDYSDMESYATKASDGDAKRAEEFLKHLWSEMKNCAGFKNIFIYRGVSLWHTMETLFNFLFSTRSRITEVTRYIRTMRNVLESETPDIVVTLDGSSCIGMPTVLMAKGMDIPVLNIQPGQIGDLGPAYADKMAVWDSGTKSHLANRGYNKDQLVVTGCPKYDSMLNDIPAKDAVKSMLHIPKSKGIILFAIQQSSSNENYLRMLFEAMKGFPSRRLVIKTHSRDTGLNYTRMAKLAGIEITVTGDGSLNLYDLISASDMMVTKSSMAGLEAVFMSKPVIIFDPIEKKDITAPPLVELGVALGTYNQKNLADAIKNVLSNRDVCDGLMKSRARFITDWGHKIDGKSSERIAELIYSLIKGSEN